MQFHDLVLELVGNRLDLMVDEISQLQSRIPGVLELLKKGDIPKLAYLSLKAIERRDIKSIHMTRRQAIAALNVIRSLETLDEATLEETEFERARGEYNSGETNRDSAIH